MRTFSLSFVTFIAFLSSTAMANDGAVGLDGGQLVFKNLKGVEMLEEDLVLSPDLVSVKYIFRNKTEKDIATHVAFPISYMLETDTTFDTKSKNPNGFVVVVNGKKTPFLSESATKNGEHIRTHYWEQIFPAGKNTVIEHQYKPIYGTDVTESMVKVGKAGTDADLYYNAFKKGFCLSDNQKALMQKDRHTFDVLTYILKTANTWDGPIGTFNLTIKKNKRKFLFLCTDLDLKKKANGDFQATVKNFKPETNLNIAFTER